MKSVERDRIGSRAYDGKLRRHLMVCAVPQFDPKHRENISAQKQILNERPDWKQNLRVLMLRTEMPLARRLALCSS